MNFTDIFIRRPVLALVVSLLILLIGLPLVAAAGGWLLAGREPEVISRQPIE